MLFLNYLIWRLFIFQNMYIEIFKFSCDFNFLSKIKKKEKIPRAISFWKLKPRSFFFFFFSEKLNISKL